ncbi:MAG: flagellar motor switch protein FliN [Pseudonocardiales bacterium]|nr:flagellar motor switch protein FliN [Pseudonocardiales bacterium]
MITETSSPVMEMLATAASSVAATLASSEALSVGEPTQESEQLDLGTAVLGRFTGSRTGDLVVVVNQELTAALAESEFGPLELAAALTPTFDAVATAVGPIVLGPLQVLDARLALHRVFAHAASAAVPLNGAAGPRAAVAIGVEPEGTPAQRRTTLEDVSAHRLDLLRGVEMAATAELGRARMTVNDLLSLRTGAVIELDRAAGAAADLFVNGRLIARGEVVVVDENYGLRITQVVTDDTGR